MEIINLIASRDKIGDARLNGLGTGNAKYTHHRVQNALIIIMNALLLHDQKEEILNAELYSVIADETKDLSKREQLSIALRYIFGFSS